MSARHWLEKFFESAFVLDDDDVGVLTPAEMRCEGDEKLALGSKVSHAFTTNATPVVVPLLDLVAGDVVELDVVLTCKNLSGSVRGSFKISALVYKIGAGDATFEDCDGTDPTPRRNPGTLDAAITLSGSSVRLELTGVAAESITWGWELRTQKQII